MKHGVICSKY